MRQPLGSTHGDPAAGFIREEGYAVVIPAPALELGIQFLGSTERKVWEWLVGGVHVGGSSEEAVQVYTASVPKNATASAHHAPMSWA